MYMVYIHSWYHDKNDHVISTLKSTQVVFLSVCQYLKIVNLRFDQIVSTATTYNIVASNYI